MIIGRIWCKKVPSYSKPKELIQFKCKFWVNVVGNSHFVRLDIKKALKYCDGHCYKGTVIKEIVVTKTFL